MEFGRVCSSVGSWNSGFSISKYSMHLCSTNRGFMTISSSFDAMLSVPVEETIPSGLCCLGRLHSVRFSSNSVVTLNTDDNVLRFSFDEPNGKPEIQKNGKKTTKRKMSRKAKINELKWYRLKAKKKMKSPNPEVRIRYKLEKVIS